MSPTLKRVHGPEETDGDLFSAIARGDLGPLGVIFDRHHEPVRQFLLRAAARSTDIDDLVQETFLTAAKAAGSYDGRPDARPFLIGVAAQLLRRRRRTVSRYGGLLERFGLAPQQPSSTPEESMSSAEQGDTLRVAIDRLPEDQRLALIMVEWNGMSGPEVARALGVPVGTVWRRLHDARAELRRVLKGGTE